MWVTNCWSLEGLYRTFVLPTDPHFVSIFSGNHRKVYKMWDLHLFFCLFFLFVFFGGDVTPWQSNMNEIFSNMLFSWQGNRIYCSWNWRKCFIIGQNWFCSPLKRLSCFKQQCCFSKTKKFETKNWMCNDVTTVHICYISLILRLCSSKLSLYCMDQC